MPDLTVVGICSYHPAVHRWLGTLREHFDGPCLLYLTNPDAATAEGLMKRYGITVVGSRVPADFWKRKPAGGLCGQWACILDACRNRIPAGGYILRTDVWDVAFQDDPRKYLDTLHGRIAVCKEGVTIGEERINANWVRGWLPLVRGAEVINGGMVSGPRESVAVLAGLIAKCPLGSAIDQTELGLIASAFPDSFVHVPFFLECMYQGYDRRGAVVDGRVCDRETGVPWCTVHANGAWHTKLFDELFPVERYQPAGLVQVS